MAEQGQHTRRVRSGALVEIWRNDHPQGVVKLRVDPCQPVPLPGFVADHGCFLSVGVVLGSITDGYPVWPADFYMVGRDGFRYDQARVRRASSR